MLSQQPVDVDVLLRLLPLLVELGDERGKEDGQSELDGAVVFGGANLVGYEVRGGLGEVAFRHASHAVELLSECGLGEGVDEEWLGVRVRE